MNIEQPTMALTLRRMERDLLISRTKDKNDGRRAIVRLTSHAEDLLPQIEAISDAINRTALGSLSDAEVERLLGWAHEVSENLADSDKIRDAVEALVQPASPHGP
ncbi:MarR family winged helix-turn-helix transcriptional regulator [Arthrobacter sp. SD76]|uniref:MarR family winged helix-turn-helix transcriptional regulator n=1 Tax=Arthrobacter sp. SD76 TaxID=3415007 RepID=UPI003C731B29